MLLGDKMKSVFLTGGSGFIGSHILDILVPQGYRVTVYDNLSNGRKEFLDEHIDKPNFTFVEADMLDLPKVIETMKGHDLVWHLASNTDIIGCHEQPDRDLKDGVVATFNTVEAMRQNEIQDIIFSSTGAVYGELCLDVATSEDAGPLLPISGYAASKIAAEGFISSYCSMFGLRGWMYRFGNVIGSRMTHGVIYDFINRLNENADELLVLGDGTQEKNYFLVEECINGMAYGYLNIPMTEEKPCDVFNLGTASVTKVTDIAEIVLEEMELKDTPIRIQGTKRAWPGDQPKVHITIDRMKELGWSAKRSSDEAVRVAVQRMLGKASGTPVV